MGTGADGRDEPAWSMDEGERRSGAHPVMASVRVSPGSAPSGTTTCSVEGPIA